MKISELIKEVTKDYMPLYKEVERKQNLLVLNSYAYCVIYGLIAWKKETYESYSSPRVLSQISLIVFLFSFLSLDAC